MEKNVNRIISKLPVTILAVLLTLAVSCGGGRYKDVKEFITEVVAVQDEFLSLIEVSVTADEAVSAIETFGDRLVKLSEKSLEIKKKYPDIDQWADNPPADLKADLAKLDDPVNKFKQVFFKENVKIIIKDKKVQTAFIELNKKMESVKFF
jgi:hypothetical protein